MLKERDQRIAALWAEGHLNQREIALKLGLHYNTVNAVLKKPAVQAYVAQLKADLAAPLPDLDDIQEGVNQAAGDALRALWQIVRHSRNETLRYKAAVEILDRASPDVAPKRQLHGDTVLSSVLVDYESVALYQALNKKRQELAAAGQAVRMIHIPAGAVALANYYERESRAYLGAQWVDAKGKPI